MKFLSPEYYQVDLNANRIHEKEWKECCEKYRNHLEKNKDKIIKRLYECYVNNEQFHDYDIVKISYYADSNKYKKQLDSVKLVLYSPDGREITLYFSEVTEFSMSTINYSTFRMTGIECIVLCEIGVKGAFNFLNFYTCNGSLLDICFKKIRIESKVMKYYHY